MPFAATASAPGSCPSGLQTASNAMDPLESLGCQALTLPHPNQPATRSRGVEKVFLLYTSRWGGCYVGFGEGYQLFEPHTILYASSDDPRGRLCKTKPNATR